MEDSEAQIESSCRVDGLDMEEDAHGTNDHYDLEHETVVVVDD